MNVRQAKKNVKMTAKPEFIYIAGLNLSGLWSKEPFRARWDPDLDAWWSIERGWSRGNCSAQKLGLDKPIGYGIIRFASADKREVQAWIDGVLASFYFLRNWTQKADEKI